MIFVAFAAQGLKLLRVCDKRAETNYFRCIVHPYLPVKLARAVETSKLFPAKISSALLQERLDAFLRSRRHNCIRHYRRAEGIRLGQRERQLSEFRLSPL